ncbi:MAG: JAB domain-containing protein [Nitrospirota bacterium]
MLKRAGRVPAPPGKYVNSPAKAAAVLTPLFRGADREYGIALGLDRQCRPLGVHVISMGQLASHSIHPREVFKALILMNAHAWVFAHNHPSGGDLRHSKEDHAVTRELVAASALMAIPLVDHLIFTSDGRYRSLGDAGLLDPPQRTRGRKGGQSQP